MSKISKFLRLKIKNPDVKYDVITATLLKRERGRGGTTLNQFSPRDTGEVIEKK